MSQLFGIVGPSGAGKDTLMEAAARQPGVALVRRVITRPADAGGEAHIPATEEEFARARARGEFALDWQAHGLSYAIPQPLPDAPVVLMNLSRAALPRAAEVFPALTVVLVTARPEVLAQRLAARGREDAESIAARIARSPALDTGGLPLKEVDNSTTVDRAVIDFLLAIGITP